MKHGLRRLRGDGAPLILLFAFGAITAGRALFDPASAHYTLNQSVTTSHAYAASAMIALGRGFGTPAGGEPPVLTEFLMQKRASLGAADLPPGTKVDGPVCWETHHRYLIYFVAALWKLFGLSWTPVKLALAVVYGICGALAYTLLRSGANRFFAVLGAVAFLNAPLVYGELSHMRDFLKTPFFLAAWCLLAWLMRRPPSRRWYLAAAMLLGAVIGIGMGFRHDVLICLGAASVVLMGTAQGPWRHAARDGALALALMGCAFLATSWPVYRAYAACGAPVHDLFMGLSTSADSALGMEPAAYNKLYIDHDFIIYAMETDFQRRSGTDKLPASYDDPAAEAAGAGILREYALRFPADFIARGLAAIVWCLEGAHPFQAYDTAILPVRFFRLLAIAGACLGFVLLCAHNRRTAWLALFLLVFFAGYTCIQFQYRHVFHLKILGLWLPCFLGSFAAARTMQFARSGLHAIWRDRLPRIRQPLLHLAIALLLAMAPAALARAYQSRSVHSWLKAYAEAPLDPVPTEICTMRDWVYFPITDAARHPLPASSWPYATSSMAVTLSRAPERIWLVYVSEGTPAAYGEFTYTFRPPFTWSEDAGPTRFFFPVYEGTNFLTGRTERFAGIALPAHDAAAFKGLHRMRDDARLNVLQCVWLPSDASLLQPYQRIGIPRTTENPRIPPFNIRECVRSG